MLKSGGGAGVCGGCFIEKLGPVILAGRGMGFREVDGAGVRPARTPSERGPGSLFPSTGRPPPAPRLLPPSEDLGTTPFWTQVSEHLKVEPGSEQFSLPAGARLPLCRQPLVFLPPSILVRCPWTLQPHCEGLSQDSGEAARPGGDCHAVPKAHCSSFSGQRGLMCINFHFKCVSSMIEEFSFFGVAGKLLK